MTIKLNAATRLVQATLDDTQINALRTRVLPMFEPIIKTNSNAWLVTPSSNGRPANRPHKRDDLCWLTWRTFVLARDLMQAAVGKGTPALRSSRLQHALSDNHNSNVTIDKLIIVLIGRANKLLRNSRLNADVRKQLQDFLNDPTLKLLKASWAFIVAELRSEMRSVLKKYNLMISPKGESISKATSAKILERFVKYCKSLGFSVGDYPAGSQRWYAEGCMLATKSLEGGKAEIRFVAIPDQGIFPSYTIGTNPGEYSWAQRGVDSGITSWGGESTIEATIDFCLGKCEESIEKRLHLDANGTEVDFGGRTLRLLPEKLEAIISQLKSGKSFSINPSGFGDQYTYSTTPSKNSWQRKGLASKQISDLVGKQVYYTISELD